MRHPRTLRTQGALLTELVAALSIITVGVLSFLATFRSNANAFTTVDSLDEVNLALENYCELLRVEEFSAIFDVHHGDETRVMTLPDLSDGTHAKIVATCFVDETAVPTEFGSLIDLDGDPDTDETDCSVTYQILPIRLVLTYGSDHGDQSSEMYITLGED
ncbi:MAG: hypothetical protein AAF517_11365 [Planctomycetota bacterium]